MPNKLYPGVSERARQQAKPTRPVAATTRTLCSTTVFDIVFVEGGGGGFDGGACLLVVFTVTVTGNWKNSNEMEAIEFGNLK